jgi:hypothetical protein
MRSSIPSSRSTIRRSLDAWCVSSARWSCRSNRRCGLSAARIMSAITLILAAIVRGAELKRAHAGAWLRTAELLVDLVRDGAREGRAEDCVCRQPADRGDPADDHRPRAAGARRVGAPSSAITPVSASTAKTETPAEREGTAGAPVHRGAIVERRGRGPRLRRAGWFGRAPAPAARHCGTHPGSRPGPG